MASDKWKGSSECHPPPATSGLQEQVRIGEEWAGNLPQGCPGLLEQDREGDSRGSLVTFLGESLKFGQTQAGNVGLPCGQGGCACKVRRRDTDPASLAVIRGGSCPTPSPPSVQERGSWVTCVRLDYERVYS